MQRLNINNDGIVKNENHEILKSVISVGSPVCVIGYLGNNIKKDIEQIVSEQLPKQSDMCFEINAYCISKISAPLRDGNCCFAIQYYHVF